MFLPYLNLQADAANCLALHASALTNLGRR